IEAYKIDPNQLTEEILTQVFACTKISLADGFDRLFGKHDANSSDGTRLAGPLLKSLEVERNNNIVEWLEKLPHATLFQTIGNCAWESPKTAVYATIALQSAMENNLSSSTSHEAIALAEKSFVSFIKWERYTKLETTIHALNMIEKRILGCPENKNSMLEGALLVLETYQKDTGQDFWEQRKIVHTKFQNIHEHFTQKEEITTTWWTNYKVHLQFASLALFCLYGLSQIKIANELLFSK
ncbi:MAG TPA: hypothetical protein VGP47_02415, partial [Parachlamydiaceae bacterium]|nr:hypothetical protein [Parachlamydiaceae bacterium]